MDALLNKLILHWVELRERWGVAERPPVLSFLLLFLLVVQLALGWYWGREPGLFAVGESGPAAGERATVATLVRLGEVLTGKPGGYLRNDLLPPGLLMDNVPAWEAGVLTQLRDMVQAMGQGGRSKGGVDPDIAEAAAALAVPDRSWVMPSAEGELVRGTDSLRRYGDRLVQSGLSAPVLDAEHLAGWLVQASDRLGQMSARLNAALPAYAAPPPGSPVEGVGQLPKTTWWRVDDVFYEARGSAWALLHLLKAVEADQGALLLRHQAELSLRAAIHELEATQRPVWSPMILNGSGFGLFANHSLIMANYLNRAQANLADVLHLLQAGR